jgi:PAS domain S-box-containing protein
MREPRATDRAANPRPIRLVLAVGFLLLLSLIGLLGALSTSELNALRNAANDRNRSFTGRLELAIKLREEAGRAIAEARLYRATQSLGVPGPAYRVELAGAKLELEKLLAWGQTLNLAETGAWREVEEAVRDFWAMFNAETAVSDEEFFARRKRLDQAAHALVEAVSREQQQNLDATAEMQAAAARRIRQAAWLAVVVGLVVAAFTFGLIHSQFLQLRRAVRRAQEAQDFARSVFDSLADDVLVISERGELLAANQAFLTRFKITAVELARRDYQGVLATVPEVTMFVGKALRERGDDQSYRERIEVSARGEEAERRLLDVYVSPLTIGGERRGRVVVMVDVTEAERAREELRRNRTLSTIGQVTAQVAHEIYNPLGALKLNLELLEHQLNGHAAAQPTVDRLKRGLDHLSSIVMDLRDLTRPRDPERKPVDLNALLDDVVELAHDRLQRKDLRVQREYDRGAPRGEFDPTQLRKVFLNLLINAVDASPKGGELALRTRFIPPGEAVNEISAARGLIVASVIDHGAGMSAETKRRLFEPLYSTKQHGTGLGMTITQEIIRKHSGKIEVESQEGRGTTVSVYLPL